MPITPPSNDNKPQGHLINLLTKTSDHHPNFTLLLGAGASVSSGVPSASSMINDWRKEYAKIYGEDDSNAQQYLNSPDEYSFLFEQLFDQASQRRDYIETCLRDASPSWGYIYLVNLLGKGAFQTIFTTNFDDLVNEACFRFSSTVRPVVSAHDSSVENIRIFSNRPKIIKLHGDFLFDNIKNTSSETASLEANMRSKFEQYGKEFGLIVIGYAGNDKSVIDPIDSLLKSDDFPNGVYWCIRAGARLSKSVERLRLHPSFHIVEIQGFDEFFAELHNSLDLALPEELADPYTALTGRLDNLMRSISLPSSEKSHPVIERDVAQIASQILSVAIGDKVQTDRLPVTNQGNAKLTSISKPVPVPFEFLANFFLRRGEVQRAQLCIAEGLDRKPNSSLIDFAFNSLRYRWDDQFAEYVMSQITDTPQIFAEGNIQPTTLALHMMHASNFDLAEQLLVLEAKNPNCDENILLLNQAQMYRHKNISVPEDILGRIRLMVNHEDCHLIDNFGGSIILEEWEDAEEALQKIIEDNPVFASEIPKWPIAKLLMPHIQNELIKSWLTDMQKDYHGPTFGNYSIHNSIKRIQLITRQDTDEKDQG